MHVSAESDSIKQQLITKFEYDTPEELEANFVHLLQVIQAPPNLRGFRYALLALVALSKCLGTRFSQYFGVTHNQIQFIEVVVENLAVSSYPQLSEHRSKKGWCSERPVYVLLFYYQKYGHENVKAEWLSRFFSHYFDNKQLVDSQYGDRVTESCTKMRLLLLEKDQSQISPVHYIRLNNSQLIAEELVEDSYGEHLVNANAKYMRELAHFFALDWRGKKTRRRRDVTRHSDTRRNRTKLEPIIGGGPDLLAKIPEVTNEADLKGLNLEDCFADIESVQDENEVKQRPIYEVPLLAPVRDKSLRELKRKNITHKVRRSHNITLMDKGLLQPHELIVLFERLGVLAKQKNREVKGTPSLIVVLSCWCMLLLGKSLDGILALKISKQRNENGVLKHTDAKTFWQFEVLQSVQTVNESLSDYCRLSIPEFLAELITEVDRQYPQQTTGYLIPNKYDKTIKESVSYWLAKVSDKSGARLSEQRLSGYISHRLIATEMCDPVIFDFAFGSKTYLSRVTRHYSQLTTPEIAEKLNQFWLSVINDIKRVDKEFDAPNGFYSYEAESPGDALGSSYTPSQPEVENLVKQLQQAVFSIEPELAKKQLKSLVKYHNSYVAYVAYMVLYATGYRAVYNPLPSLDLIIPRYRVLVISDKDDSDFTHTRLVTLPELLTDQVENYRRHLGAIKGYLAAFQPEVVCRIKQLIDETNRSYFSKIDENQRWYKEIKNSRTTIGPLFYLTDTSGGIRAHVVSPNWLSKQVYFQYPLNACRHFLRTELLRRNVSNELINFQLGHWSVGQAPLSDFSSFEFSEAIVELLPELNDILEDCQWQSLASAII